MTLEDIKKERLIQPPVIDIPDSTCMTSIKSEQEYANNNQTDGKWTIADPDQTNIDTIQRVGGVGMPCTTKNPEGDSVTTESSDMEESKEQENAKVTGADGSHPTTMNLRKFRRATAKKQILDSLTKFPSKQNPQSGKEESSKVYEATSEAREKAPKRKISQLDDTIGMNIDEGIKEACDTRASLGDEAKCQTPLQKHPKVINNNTQAPTDEKCNGDEYDLKEKELSEEKYQCMLKNKFHHDTDNSETNSMTLQQFTDIVLASEGMTANKGGHKEDRSSQATPSTPHRKNSLQSSCGGDDEASNSSPTNYSSIIDRKESTDSINKISCYNVPKMISSKALKTSPGTLSCSVKLEQIEANYGCNNNILDTNAHTAMVANIMNNKDLTVEVKPMNVKPIVLSPRHPHGHNYHFQEQHPKDGIKNVQAGDNGNPWHLGTGQRHLEFVSNSKYNVSNQQRINRFDSDNSSCSGDMIDKKGSPLPKGRPPSIPKMVEEWLQKMQPPQLDEEESNYDGTVSDIMMANDRPVPRKHQLTLRNPDEMKTNKKETVNQLECDSNTVLNLSTKDCTSENRSEVIEKTPRQDHQMPQCPLKGNAETNVCRETKILSSGKPTQVYLRPIPTNEIILDHNTKNRALITLPKSHMPLPGKHQTVNMPHENGVVQRRPDYEQIVILGRHNGRDQYTPTNNSQRYYNQTNLSKQNVRQPEITGYHKSSLPGAPTNIRKEDIQPARPVCQARQILSPPNLEITRITSCPDKSSAPTIHPLTIHRFHKNVRDYSDPTSTTMNIVSTHRASSLAPANTQRENITSRAVRDIQLAHTKDHHGNCPIHISVLMRKPELVKRYCCVLQILESTIDLRNDDKLTPLHLAIRDNSLEIIELLLAFGADPALRDNKGNTGLHVAAALGASACLQLLAGNTKHKDDLNELNDCGITPLQISMMNSDKISTDILIGSGANMKLVDPKLLQSKHGSLLPLGTAKAK